MREVAAARERDSERKTTEAADLVQRGDLAGAERLLTSAAELNPENSRVALVAAQLQEAIERRAEAERVRQRAADLVRAAAQPLQSPNAQTPDLVEALSRLDEALVLDPDNAEAPALRPALETALEASREQVRLLAAIGNARRRFANGKHQAALQLLESLQPKSHPLVVKALSELRAAQHRIEQQQQRIDAGLAAAAKHAQRLKFPQAIHDLEEVLRLEPDHERATQLLAEVREAEQRHRVAQEVEGLLKQAAAADSHERALALLRKALKIAPDDRRVIDMMLERTTALSPEIGELTIDMSTRRPGAAPAPYRQLKAPTPPALPKPAALGILANRQSILIVGSAVVVALAILAFQFWPSRQATDAGKTGAVSAGPVSAAIPVSTFTLVISGDYPFEVEIQGATRPASTTHSINLPAGAVSQVRLKRPEVFLDVSETVRGEAGELKMLRAPALSSVTVYNSFNSACEILIDGRLVGRDPVTQALIAGGHNVSLKCAEGRTPMPKHVDVVATRANQVTFTKQD